MAFLMAIGLAFATQRNVEDNPNLVFGYIHQGTDCVREWVNCENSGSTLCKIGSQQVFKDNQCKDAMFRYP